MLKRSLEKGTTVERLKITQRTVFHRAGNCVSGPEIPPQGQKFGKVLYKTMWGNAL
jgi:hypothetical protein